MDGYGRFEAYTNRDSLKYRSVYGLDDALTCYRGTIRRVGYSRAWDILVQLGMTIVLLIRLTIRTHDIS